MEATCRATMQGAVMLVTRQKTLRGKRWQPGDLAALAASPHAVANAMEDIALFDLAEEISAADHTLQAAATELARAERRLVRTAVKSADGDLPAWFLACEE